MSSVTRKSQDGRSRREAAEADVFAALERLLSGGASFTELGVQQIAEEAGIGRSTFYVHFADKSQLLIRFARAATQELFAAATGWTTSWDLAELETTLAAIIRERRKHAPALRALAEVAPYEPDIGRAWRAMVGSNIDLVRERIESDQERGLVPSEVNAHVTASYLTWGVERAVGQHVDGGDPTPDDVVAAAIARTIWNAIYGTPDAQL